MTKSILSTVLFAITVTAGCQPSSNVRPASTPTSGIVLSMSSSIEGGSMYQQGRLRVQSLDTAQTENVLVGPPTSDNRVELPPGAYSVSYEPLMRPSQNVDEPPPQVVSPNPFVVVVSRDRFTPINVRVIDAEQAEPLQRSGALAHSAEE